MFEWDEEKRRATYEKHGIDFRDAVEIFSGQHLDVPARSEVEPRRCAIGEVDGIMIAVVYTARYGKIRIITARRARRNERRAYHANVSRGDPKPPRS